MKNLFEDFKASSAADWKNQIIKDLKGDAFETLQWQHDNGILVNPFYTAENIRQTYLPAFTHSDWEIGVNEMHESSNDLNKSLLTNLDRGASSFFLRLGKHDLNVAMNAVKLNYIHSSFEINKNNVHQLRAYFETHYDLNDVQSAIFFEDFEHAESLEEWYRCMEFFLEFRKIKAIGFNAMPFHNLNALAYYEVAIIFSGIIEQIEFLNQKGNISTADIVIKTGLDSDFFTQIAKLRAIRRLWHCFKSEYKLKNNIYLIAETGLRNKSIGDKHNNLLRSSVEAMAAVAGGCNELFVNDFDVFNAVKDKASTRLALNQQLILKHESYFDKFADVACGSYYIENLTDSIAEKALETFKDFEKEGGFLNCVKKNIFKTNIEKQAALKQEEVNSQKQVVIGVNKFRNEKESIVLSETEITSLQQLPIHNPSLSYELQNFSKHA
ncbi:MAG: methylmalonyl-CoA mutase family protein [Bacteroidota bacterium]